MGAMFYLMALALFIKGRISSGGRRYLCWAGMTFAYFLGLFTKENVAILPLFIALYEFYFFQNAGFNLQGPQGKKALTYVFGTVALIGLLGFLIFGDRYYEVIVEGYKIRDFTLTERVLTQFRVVVHYVTLLLYPAPSRLNLDYDFPLSRGILDPWMTLFSILIIAGLIGYSVWVARKRPLLSYFVLWFFGNLAIESSIFPLEMVFEHRLYLPSVGPIVLFVVSLLNGWERLMKGEGRKRGQWFPWAFFFCLTLLFTAGSYQRNLVWKDAIILWQDVLTKSPDKSRPHNNLGGVYNERGMTDKAIEQLQIALSLEPGYAAAHNNLGLAYDKKGLVDEAIEQFRIAIRLKPLSGTYVNLGVAYSNKGLIDEAIKQYRVAIEMNPDNVDAYVNLGIAYGEKGFIGQAIEYLETAVRLSPEDAHAHHNLANAYRITGLLDKAQEHLQKAKNLQRK
jgi:Tfp pilus assembly protein PilF